MASFNSWNGEKLHGYKYLLTDVLKEQMGFDGIVVGDWNGHRRLEGVIHIVVLETINAGLDMFYGYRILEDALSKYSATGENR